jgi:hypothetical protein
VVEMKKPDFDSYDLAIMEAIKNEWLTKTQIARKTLISYTSVSNRISKKLKGYIDMKNERNDNRACYKLKRGNADENINNS